MARPLQGGITKLVAKGLRKADMLSPATLTRPVSTMRVPGAVSGGLNPTPTTYACEGLVSSKRYQFVAGTQVQSGDRVVVLFVVPAGVTPAAGDKVTIDGVTSRVVSVDSAAAIHTLLTRE